MTRSFFAAALFSSFVGLALPACGSSETKPEATEVSAEEARKLLASTPWLDHMPAGESDPIDLLIMDRGGQGVYIRGSAYRGTYDGFRYEATDDELRVQFLDGGAKVKSKYKIERINRQGFDLKLTFTTSPRGPSTYYGFASGRELPAHLTTMMPGVAAQ